MSPAELAESKETDIRIINSIMGMFLTQEWDERCQKVLEAPTKEQQATIAKAIPADEYCWGDEIFYVWGDSK
jgi:hypothetical protein